MKTTSALSLDDLPLAEIEHGPLRREAEDVLNDAVQRVCSELHISDPALMREARWTVLSHTFVRTLDRPWSVVQDGEGMRLAPAAKNALPAAFEAHLRVFFSVHDGGDEGEGDFHVFRSFRPLLPAYSFIRKLGKFLFP